jgi:hypothetical protein
MRSCGLVSAMRTAALENGISDFSALSDFAVNQTIEANQKTSAEFVRLSV